MRPSRWPKLIARIALVCCFLLRNATAQSQVPSPADDPSDKFSMQNDPISFGSLNVGGSIRVRIQGWNWFEDNDRDRYAFGESTLRLRIGQTRERFDWQIEAAQPTLFGLPSDAIVPGTGDQLGIGGTYFAANHGAENTAGAFIKQAFVAMHGSATAPAKLWLGRFTFNEGDEGTTENAVISWLKHNRIGQRLIGDGDWTVSGRSLDGIHFSHDINSSGNFTLVAARPTTGMYDVHGMGELNVDVAYASYTQEIRTKLVPQDFRLFAVAYHDGRNVLKVDDRTLAERVADSDAITIGTFGGDYVFTFKTPIGAWDFLGWGGVQEGSWGRLDHRASAAAAEVGWQPPIPKLHPWLRACAYRGGGDANPNDSEHGTFIQPLPTTHWYARFPFYTLQNTEDFTGQLLLHPIQKLWLHSEIHKVKLADHNDLWYQGDGPFQRNSFGYTGKVATDGSGGLGNYLDTSIDYDWNEHFRSTLYVAAVSDKAIITPLRHGRKAGFAYLELDYHF